MTQFLIHVKSPTSLRNDVTGGLFDPTQNDSKERHCTDLGKGVIKEKSSGDYNKQIRFLFNLPTIDVKLFLIEIITE